LPCKNRVCSRPCNCPLMFAVACRCIGCGVSCRQKLALTPPRLAHPTEHTLVIMNDARHGGGWHHTYSCACKVAWKLLAHPAERGGEHHPPVWWRGLQCNAPCCAARARRVDGLMPISHCAFPFTLTRAERACTCACAAGSSGAQRCSAVLKSVRGVVGCVRVEHTASCELVCCVWDPNPLN